MKKLLLMIVSAMLVALAGCNGVGGASEAEQVRAFAGKFIQFVKSNNHDSIVAMYKDLEGLDVRFAELGEEINVEEDADSPGTFKVTIGDADFMVERAQDGTMTITKSHGLLVYDASKIDFARKTGQFKDGLNDVEQAQRMCDEGFDEYLLSKVNSKMKGGLRIIGHKTYGDEYYDGEWMSAQGMIFTIKNNLDVAMPGSAYSVIYKSGYWGDMSSAQTEVIPGRDIEPNGTVTVRSTRLGPDMESDDKWSIRMNDVSPEQLLEAYSPTGTEFDEYLSTKKSEGENINAGSGDGISGNYVGEVGGSGCEMLIYGNEGTYTMSYDSDKRTLKRQSTGVYKAYKYGKFIGTFRGKFSNGTYKGRFYNPKGASSPFSLNLDVAF